MAARMAALAMAACPAPPQGTSPAPAAAAADASTARAAVPLDGRSLHFSRLQPFAPDNLLGLRGAALSASTSQYGDVAVSEVERSYSNGRRTARLRIVDASLNQNGEPPAPGPAFEDERRLSRPLHTPGAQGMVSFDKDTHQAVASLVVADRILVSVALEDAKGPEEVERLASALDLRGLASLVRRHPTP